jgi:gephyrin
MVEDTELVSTVDGTSGIANEEKEVEVLVQVPPADNVRAPGSDVRKDDLVMRAGDRVSRGGGEVGTLSFVGRKEVSMFSYILNFLFINFPGQGVQKASCCVNEHRG